MREEPVDEACNRVFVNKILEWHDDNNEKYLIYLSVIVNEIGKGFRRMEGFATFVLLVGLIDDEAGQQGVHGQTNDGHEESGYTESQNEHELHK